MTLNQKNLPKNQKKKLPVNDFLFREKIGGDISGKRQ